MKTFDDHEKEAAEAKAAAEIAQIEKQKRENTRASQVSDDLIQHASRKHILLSVGTYRSTTTITREDRTLEVTTIEQSDGDFRYDIKAKPDEALSTEERIGAFWDSLKGPRTHDEMLGAVREWLQQ